MIEILSTEDFKEKILESEKRVLVDFFATWCGPCKMQGPILDALKAEYPDMEIAKVDIDQNKDLALEYNIMSVPTIMVFENGEVIQTTMGLQSKDDLLNLYNI